MKIGTKIKHQGRVWAVANVAADGVLIEDADGEMVKLTTEAAMAKTVRRRKPPVSREAETKPVLAVGGDPVITRQTLIAAMVAQTVFIVAWCIGGAHLLDIRHHRTPTPDPIVNPDTDPPIPTPAPVASLVKKGALLIVVEETANRDKFPHLSTLQKDVKFWDALPARGYKYAWLDAEMKQIQPYKSHWEKVGLPCLLAIMPDATVPLAVPCPPSTETINQYLEP